MIITRENYFSKEANNEYMGSTQFKRFLECEAAFVGYREGFEANPNPAFLAGHYFHAWNEGRLKEFKMEHPELFKKDGELLKKFKKFNDTIDLVSKDKMFMFALNGNKKTPAKKEAYYMAEMFGIKWKIMIDSEIREHNFLADLKSLKDFKFMYSSDYGTYVHPVAYYNYNYQMAIYSEVHRIANGLEKGLEPHIVALTKEPVADKQIIKFSEERIQEDLEFIKSKIPRIIELMAGTGEPPKSCGKCEYCKKNKILKEVMDFEEINKRR